MTTEQHPYSLESTLKTISNNFLILLIILIAFAAGVGAGSLWTENRMLRTSAKNPAQQAAVPDASPAGAPQPTTATVDMGHFPVQGDKNAKVAIVAFADMRCPFCKQFFETTEPQIISDYVKTGKAQFTYRHYQFLGPASITAGNAIECANEQGKFWEYYEYLFKNQPSESDTSMYVSDKLTEIAGTLGLNSGNFKNCLDNTKFAKNITDDKAAGDAAGISGTPSFVIGKIENGKVTGDLIVGAQPYASFQAAIDKALQ